MDASNRDKALRGMELAQGFAKSGTVRVVTIKHPPHALDGITPDKSMLGKIYDLPPHIAFLMIAAGWMRGESRTGGRRQQDLSMLHNRRRAADRRSIIA